MDHQLVYPMSAVDPGDLRIELGTVCTRMVIAYLEETRGVAEMERVVHESRMNIDHIEGKSNWVSMDYYCRLLQRVVDITGDPMAPFNVGKCASKRKSFGAMEPLLVRLGSVRSAYSIGMKLYPTWDRMCSWRQQFTGRNRLRLWVKNEKYPQDRNNCMCVQGGLAAVPEIFGYPPARIDHVTCACDGHDECVYDVQWRVLPKRTWGWAGLGIGVAFAAWHLVMAGPGLRSIIAAIVCVALGSRLGLSFDYEIGLRHAFKSSDEHARDLEDSVRDIQKMNEDLQATVERRTMELKQSNDDLHVAMQQLQESQRAAIEAERQTAVGVLAGGMAHELNNPVNAIRLAVQTARSLTDEDDKRYAMLNNAERATSRCKRIVGDLLSFSRQQRSIAKTDLCHVISRLVEKYEADGPDGPRIELHLPESAQIVEVDEEQMNQAIFNLVENSAQAMPDGGNITIRVIPRDNDVLLVYTDNGPGIAGDVLDRIFDPFFSTKKASGSHGLGLAITSEMIRRNGGTITASSDKGARFEITFPANR